MAEIRLIRKKQRKSTRKRWYHEKRQADQEKKSTEIANKRSGKLVNTTDHIDMKMIKKKL